jgi:predicted  nucleic acid-binding Zn-ribbon protein
MMHRVARCPSCGAILPQEPGSASPSSDVRAAIDRLQREVARLTEIAGLKEAALAEEIRSLRETVARLRAHQV